MRSVAMVAYAMLVLPLAAGPTFAACSGTALSGGNVNQVVGKYACLKVGGVIQNNEYHATGGILQDYKKGPSDPVDPTSTIGQWAVTVGQPDTITYSYTGGPTYTYQVYSTAGTTIPGTFCFSQIPSGITYSVYVSTSPSCATPGS